MQEEEKKDLEKMKELIKINAHRISRMSLLDHINLKTFSEQTKNPDLLNFPKNNQNEKIKEEGPKEIRLSKGVFFEGNVKKNKLNGTGKFGFKDSTIGDLIYEGDFLGNKTNGFGKLEAGSKTYKGNFRNNKIEGLGELTTNHFFYTGQWLENKPSGYGRIIKKEFSMYEGQFLKNLREGLGVEIYSNSDIYIGEFKDDAKNGLGLYFFQKGGFYYGFFSDNTKNGYGVLYNKSLNLIYRGFWKNDKKHGIGFESYKNGSKYDGFFENDLRHGIGFMIYNNNLEYLGEWENGEKNGLGKLDINNKTIIGRFMDGKMIEMRNLNPSVFLNKLNSEKNPANVEEYIQLQNYKIKKHSLRYSTELYKVIKETISEFIFEMVKNGILRLKCYIKMKNLFERLSFEDIINEISINLKFTPNMKYLESFWPTNLAELCRDKVNYFWDVWKINKIVSKDKLDIISELKNEESRNIFEEMEFEKTSEKVNLKLSNVIVEGNTDKFLFEGVLTNSGFFMNSFEKDTMIEEEKIEGIIFPFFLTIESNLSFNLLTIKVIRYTGEFYFFKNSENPRKIVIYLGFDQLNNIYSLGIDTVGSYVVLGDWNKKEKKGTFLQKYFLNYQIQYEAFFFTFKKIQGFWKTTNLNGYFLMRKDESFNPNNSISLIMQNYFDSLKKKGEYDIFADKTLKDDLNSSILAVVVKNKQKGIPVVKKENENEENDHNLFEKYKKQNQNEEHVMNKRLTKKLTMEDQIQKSIVSIDSSLNLDDITDSQVQKALGQNLISKLTKKSFVDINMKIKQQVKEIEKESTQKEKSNLVAKLSTALKQLKSVQNLKLNSDFSKHPDIFKSIATENFNWSGIINTLGKEDNIIVNNLIVNGDFVEGVYQDENILYDLAGSCSVRTKEIEIIGMSSDKKESIKIKGFLKGFKIVGNFLKRNSNVPESSIFLEFKGYKAKINLKIPKISLTENDALIKVTDHYIYGIILYEQEFFFVTGHRNKNEIFAIEVLCTLRNVKKYQFYQIVKNNKNSNKSEIHENLFFKDDDNNSLDIIFC